MKYELSFGTHKDPHVCGVYDTPEQARAEMVRQLNEKGIKSYYYRQVGEIEDCFIDYGSWTYFYFIRAIDKN